MASEWPGGRKRLIKGRIPDDWKLLGKTHMEEQVKDKSVAARAKTKSACKGREEWCCFRKD